MNTNIVFDASALLALILQEKGAELIRPLLKKAVMSAINVAEVLTALQRVNISPKESLTSITDIICTILPFDIEQAQYVAELQPHVQHKGLSLGDRACIALGMKLQAPIYTADKIWSELQLTNVDIKLIR
jgi:PIN domain nuclease of toxin-antitoxin system